MWIRKPRNISYEQHLKKMNKFQRYVVEHGGPEEMAKKLRVTSSVVRAWLRREYTPRIVVILEIVLLSKGDLSSQDIIDCTTPKRRRARHQIKSAKSVKSNRGIK